MLVCGKPDCHLVFSNSAWGAREAPAEVGADYALRCRLHHGPASGQHQEDGRAVRHPCRHRRVGAAAGQLQLRSAHLGQLAAGEGHR